MQALVLELARRGTLVTPAALARLEKAPHLAEALLAQATLPFVLTPEGLDAAAPAAAPPDAPAPPPESGAPEPPRAEEGAAPGGTTLAANIAAALMPARAAVAVVAQPVPAPFTPDARPAAVALDEPHVPAPLRPVGGPLPVRPTLMEPYAHGVDILADVTGNSTCEGAITDFTRYFNDRLDKIRKMLKQRREMVGFVRVANARSAGAAEIKLVGIVAEIRTTKNGHRLIELEDETGTVNILAPASDTNLIVEADSVIEDEVVGVVCKPPGRGDLLILQHIVRPDIPMTAPGRRSTRGSAVAILSDIHFGAKTFLHEDWERFLRWINLDWGDSRMKALARKVRYLVVNGDIVDGIGIFPGQEEELAIVDAYDQYQYAGEQLNRIRDDVQIFVLPGNHDLVRPAEPQPALPDKYKRLFSESVRHVGNPCKLSIEGVEMLSYHGRSMDDWITRVAGLSYDNPIRAMKEMVLRRHMVPVYGLRTPIAPEHKDYLTIDSVPDVFVTGHVHAAGLEQYKGVTLINASCWQSQTAYQKMHGFTPEPSKVPVVELDTGKPWMVDFHRGKPAGVDVVGRSAFGGAFRQPEKIANPGDLV